MSIQPTTCFSPVEALTTLIRSLVAYEQRYQMTSTDFYARYQRGEMEDTADYVEWAGDYQHYVQLKAELEQKLAAAGGQPLRHILHTSAGSFSAFRQLLPSGTKNSCSPPREGICVSGCALPIRRCWKSAKRSSSVQDICSG